MSTLHRYCIAGVGVIAVLRAADGQPAQAWMLRSDGTAAKYNKQQRQWEEAAAYEIPEEVRQLGPSPAKGKKP